MNPRQNYRQLQQNPAKFHSVVEIKSVTWNKDNHGLFDYESQSLEVKKFQIPDSSQIIRKFDHEIIVTKQPIFQSETVLANIEIKDQNSFLVPQLNKDLETYLIVRSLKNSEGQQKGYELKEGDTIKLGRIEFKVIELNNQLEQQRKDTPQYPMFEVKEEKREGLKTCRICLLEEENSSDTIEQVFINPCKCKGTTEFVHLGCLKEWIANKIVQKISGCIVCFKMKKFECEICKHPLPRKIKLENNQIIDIIEYSKPTCPYMFLECITQDKKNSSNLYLIHFLASDSVKLGRGHACDIRISDISVSRTHALLNFENGKFLVFDNNSKFGSLIKTENPQPINHNKIAIQYGRTVLTFVMKYLPSVSQQHQLKQKQYSPYKNFKTWKTIDLIIKSGDNLKQEQFGMQLLSQFIKMLSYNQIFQLIKM